MPLVSRIYLSFPKKKKNVLSIYFWAKYGKGNHFSQKSWRAMRNSACWELHPLCLIFSP